MLRSAIALSSLAAVACAGDDGGGSDAGGPVTVLAPNGGEALTAGEPFELQWSVAAPASAPFDVELVDGAGVVTAIARDVQETTLAWAPPGVAASASFRVRVTAKGGGASVDDSSDADFTISPPTTGTSLARDVQPIFDRSCNVSLCHGASSQVALLNLAPGAAHAALVNVASVAQACSAHLRVRPGLPDQSYLVWKLAGAGACVAGVRMPKNASPLPAAEIAVIRAWIAEGAKHN